LFIAQIYNFTVGAIINRPKKVCAIYAGEQCSPLQEKTFNRAICEGFLSPHPPLMRSPFPVKGKAYNPQFI